MFYVMIMSKRKLIKIFKLYIFERTIKMKNIFKTIISLSCALAILLGCFSGCSDAEQADSGEGLNIVTTLFPAYDFAKNIAGDNAEVSLLLSPGVESHSYEPTPKDMASIQQCDLFIYNGGESEAWVDSIIDSSDGSFTSLKMLDCTDALLEEDHDEDEDHDHEGDEVGYDEHIWTSPKICIEICSAIKDELCKLDSENAEAYEQAFEDYSKKLSELDSAIADTVDNAKRKEIIFADRFPFKYFAEEYGLTYYAAFPGCSTQTEPSAAKIAQLIQQVNEDDIPVVFYVEMSNQKVADTIMESTNAEKLLFHSCHNLTKDEMDSGEDYLSLMYKNLDNLSVALN